MCERTVLGELGVSLHPFDAGDRRYLLGRDSLISCHWSRDPVDWRPGEGSANPTPTVVSSFRYLEVSHTTQRHPGRVTPTPTSKATPSSSPTAATPPPGPGSGDPTASNHPDRPPRPTQRLREGHTDTTEPKANSPREISSSWGRVRTLPPTADSYNPTQYRADVLTTIPTPSEIRSTIGPHRSENKSQVR